MKGGFYKYATPWTAEDTKHAVGLLYSWLPWLFPLSLPISRGRSVEIATGDDFHRDDLPASVTGGSSVFLAFRAHDGTRIDIAETQEAGLRPGTMVISSSTRFTLPELWGLVVHAGDVAADTVIFGDEHVMKEMQRRSLERNRAALGPLVIGWLNYWSAAWVRNLSEDQKRELRRAAVKYEMLASGALVFALQEDAYENDNEFHRRRREKIEKTLGLDSSAGG